MPYHFTLDDVAFLRSGAGSAALAACSSLPLTDKTRIADVAAVRRIAPDHAAAVLETVVLRRKSSAKLDSAGSWLFTGDALQQASATLVARHRASRLAGRDVHDVTCSVGADLVEIARVAAKALGSDLDEVRLAMARHNAAEAGVSPALLRADALRPVSRSSVVVADPARRDSAGRRAWKPGEFLPPLDGLVEAYPGRELSVKCAPGLDFSIAPWADEVELVSLDGQVREACLWRGVDSTVSRRATVLRSDGAQWTVTDADPDEIPVREPGEWIVDPDGAVVRAGLVRHYAARHGLWQLDERIAYLTGDTPPPGIRAFRVFEHGPYSEKNLRVLLKKHDIGRLEILVRGLDIDPDALRRKLKPRGGEEATLVLTRIGRSGVAFLCRAQLT
ncbi:Putative S-adenosylmethionine-dependent methyltransferase MT3122/Rv3037c [Amycolatopsis japonica]|uniref:Putative S-adenosylmethionine-dependent methyltransferase MT3122/Rv3037c n=1 Tax=Amycolatopsis japonica TaxID=208439 RepID=A0A075UNK8_9PSEU|nr:class I SAM-dependent methyltransferase [Amycolatopsis japonica]AIG74473.1 Putative S-adenosylmethionine-dependent methyltransferase MT3122/Rv3037c [Amycolatopsis japonica]